MAEKSKTPYGLWSSPVSPKMVGQGLGFGDVQWNTDGKSVVWLESRAAQGVLVTAEVNQPAGRDLTVDENVRAFVGYGGGDFSVSQDQVFFAGPEGKIFKRGLDFGLPRPITPSYGKMASPQLSPDGKWVLFVYSDGKTDLLGLVDAEGAEWPLILSKGADFYMQPAWHPDGDQIAWVEWDHPNMPWDQTRIKLGRLAGSPPRLTEVKTVCDLTDLPAVEPLFSPDGRWLSYISSNGEWDRLVLLDLSSGEEKVLIDGDGFLLADPAWVQGRHSYGWSINSQKIFYTRKFGGFSTLWVVDISSGVSEEIKVQPYTDINQLSVSPTADELVFIASSPQNSTRIVLWKEGACSVIARSGSESLPVEYLPSPKSISWTSPDGMQVFSNYYPPSNPAFEGQGVPPVIVFCHGGPTGYYAVNFNLMRTYFTSRGYGCLELNYRGSAGYGLTYQRAMRQRWGDVDTVDADGAAQALIEQGLADPGKLVIMGGSAGGYTVLNTLINFPGRYKAGINLFGVSNLFNLAMDTHKFELHYLESMIGQLPETSERYRNWSPIFHAQKLKDPLAVFQGSEDPVVPPDQSEDIVGALARNGVPHIYKKYEGEGHGFRKAETKIDMLQEIERFLRQHVLFS